jgi:hypothetical protein
VLGRLLGAAAMQPPAAGSGRQSWPDYGKDAPPVHLPVEKDAVKLQVMVAEWPSCVTGRRAGCSECHHLQLSLIIHIRLWRWLLDSLRRICSTWSAACPACSWAATLKLWHV